MEADAGHGGLTPRLIPTDTTHAAPRDAAAGLSRQWCKAAVIAMAAATAGIGALGYTTVHSHRSTRAAAGADAAALAAAKACIAATQPADVAVLPAVQKKLDDCATEDFKKQITWYSAVLSEAYQAVNVHVRLPEIDAAVERTNADGSIVALVAFRADVSQDGMTDRANSYRIRVTMVTDHDQYKVAKLEQVAK